MREGRTKGSHTCDFLETVRFLNMLRYGPRNVYQLYHYEDGSGRLAPKFDIKKLYRYLRYCLSVGLIEEDHVEKEGFLPARYYHLTPKGREIIDLMELDPFLRPKL